jgi:hypothetical protein
VCPSALQQMERCAFATTTAAWSFFSMSEMEAFSTLNTCT